MQSAFELKTRSIKRDKAILVGVFTLKLKWKCVIIDDETIGC
jgi:hypothetical protein